MTKPVPQVTLEPWEVAHLARVADWLGRGHVRRWWGDPATRLAELREGGDHEQALIAVDDEPVGYLRWQRVDLADLAALGLTGIPEHAVDIDIFIGERDWLGRGVGPRALTLLLERLAARGAPLAGLCTSVDNAVAIRAFEKAGFTRLCRYQDPEFGPCWVLSAELTKR